MLPPSDMSCRSPMLADTSDVLRLSRDSAFVTGAYASLRRTTWFVELKIGVLVSQTCITSINLVRNYRFLMISLKIDVSLYCFDLGTYTYQNWAFGWHPGVWSKINLSHKARHRIQAEIIIFPLHYWAGVDSTSLPKSNCGKLSKLESLVDFGQWSSLLNRISAVAPP